MLPIGPGVTLGPAPGGYEGNGLEADLDQLVALGFRGVVCLLEEDEFEHLDEEPRLATLVAAYAERGPQGLQVPVEDFAAPTVQDLHAVRAFVEAAARPVYLHCMAGLGRAGTVAAALLIRGGMSAEDAILWVRWVRPGAIQSEEQERFLRSLSC